MPLAIIILALAVFLAGATAGILALLVVSIHRSRRARFLSGDPACRSGAIARNALISIRNHSSEEQDT